MHNLGPTRYSHHSHSRSQFSQNTIRRHLNRFSKWLKRKERIPDRFGSSRTDLDELLLQLPETESLRSLRQSLLATFDVMSLLLLFLKETQASELRTLNHSSVLIQPPQEHFSRLNQPSYRQPCPGCKEWHPHSQSGSGSPSRSYTALLCQPQQQGNSQWVSSLTAPKPPPDL